MQYADLLAAIDGMAQCDTKDFACIACNQQKSAALSNLVGGGCIPLGSKVNFSCDTSQAAINAMNANTPEVVNATVNGTPDVGWTGSTPVFTPPSSSPAPSYVPTPTPTPSQAASSSNTPTPAPAPAVDTSNWFTGSMFDGIPNWALAAAAALALVMVVKK
jgi:hypothetical protein